MEDDGESKHKSISIVMLRGKPRCFVVSEGHLVDEQEICVVTLDNALILTTAKPNQLINPYDFK